MRIAVTSQNFRTVTGHAGRARRFIVSEADGREPPSDTQQDSRTSTKPHLPDLLILDTLT
jgi:hypothetical protein